MRHSLAGLQRKAVRPTGLAGIVQFGSGVALMLGFGLMFSTGFAAEPLSGGAAVDQIRRPGQTELPPPEFEEQKPVPELVLPPVQPDQPIDRAGPQLRVFVNRFVLTGNTVFTDEELATLTAPFEGRVITSDELLEARDRITLHYIQNGYINSGALVPDQQVVNGNIELLIVEGELTSLMIAGNDDLRVDYIGDRIRLGSGPPLNVNSLQERLQILQENPLIERINATLSPGTRPGESELSVDVVEGRPYQLRLIADNRRPPSVGAEQVTLAGEHLNLTGRGDLLRGSVSLTEGLEDYYAEYRIPVTARDTELGVYYEQTNSEVIEDPFDDLDIKSDSKTLGLLLRHPVYRKPGEEIGIGLVFERKWSETELLGEKFSFAEGVDNGESDVSALRLTQDWLKRTRDRVLAARSMFSFGLNIFGATDNDSKPDGEFFAWLGQFQWAERLGGNVEMILRADAQLTPDPLLPMEKFVVGGADTVRGYRENQLVRDNGLVGSLEFRIPILEKYTGEARFRLAPFADYGRSWNEDYTPKHKTISSAGVGLLFDYKRLIARVYWAHAFDDIDNGDVEHDLQDDGVGFSLSYSVF
jgi:hemolysin activation/secretion protein